MFHGWENFYFMTGSAAASLIGLLFVVVTLTSGRELSQVMRGQALYMTPTALHYAIVLTMSAAVVAPGLSLPMMATLLGLIALVGLINALKACVGLAGLGKNPDPPHWSDFWMYGVTPMLVYLALCVTAIFLGLAAPWAPYVMAALQLTLLLTAIRNAWDLITWMAPRVGGGSSSGNG
jgi:hypothetical protein